MKTVLLLTLSLIGFFATGYGQQDSMWDKWEWLTGEWIGEGSGQPGAGGGIFSFQFELDERILVRRSHSEYPATENKPKIIHDDVMIVYPDNEGKATKAIYFDNEGHTINYIITYSEKLIILTSEKTPKVPIFRLTYKQLENEIVNTKFEMSQDGENFMTYIEGKSRRTK